jgi:hypothetical protein
MSNQSRPSIDMFHTIKHDPTCLKVASKLHLVHQIKSTSISMFGHLKKEHFFFKLACEKKENYARVEWKYVVIINRRRIGWMPPVYFSKASSCDVASKNDTDEKTWSHAMCPYTSKKKSKPLTKSFTTKQSCKNLYTILKGWLDEKWDEHVKTKINASKFKIIISSSCNGFYPRPLPKRN